MLVELGKYGLGERDLVANINFFSKVVVDDSGAHAARRGPLAGRAATSTCASRWTASCCCTPVRIRWPPARTTRRRPSACRRVARATRHGRRCLPHALPGKRARLHQHRKDVFVILKGSSTRSCPRANRGWGSSRRGQIAAHRRPRRQPGRRHAVLQRRRHRRTLQRAEHHPGAGPHLSHHRHGAALEPRQRACCASRKTPAAGTTRWAAPAPPRATPCGTRSRSGTCTPAATVSCWRLRDTANGWPA